VSEENRLVTDANVGGATNIMDNLNYIHGVSDNMIVFEKQVKCFDFSEFVKNNFTREDFIVIKFDIEGAEFPVIEKMISENTIDLVDVLYVEWHDFAMQMSSTSLVNQILSKGIKLNSWR
jgi:FkbM family methyltransferase